MNSSHFELPQICHGFDDLQVFQNCIERSANPYVETDKPAAITPIIAPNSFIWKVYPSLGSIGFNETTSMNLLLDQHCDYHLYIYARNFAFHSLNPSVTPKTFLKISQTDQYIIIFFKVSAQDRVNITHSYCPLIEPGNKDCKDEHSEEPLWDLSWLCVPALCWREDGSENRM